MLRDPGDAIIRRLRPHGRLRLATNILPQTVVCFVVAPTQQERIPYHLGDFLIKQRDRKRIIDVALNFDKSVDRD